MKTSYAELPLSNASSLLKAYKLEAEARRSTNRLKHYSPYPKQREFHQLGAEHSERLFMAGNQLGKTVAGSAEIAMHLTGRYPDWWQGATFSRPVIIWAPASRTRARGTTHNGF